MGELGENEEQYHREVGEYIAQINKDLKKTVKYLTVGKLAAGIGKILSVNGFDVKVLIITMIFLVTFLKI